MCDFCALLAICINAPTSTLWAGVTSSNSSRSANFHSVNCESTSKLANVTSNIFSSGTLATLSNVASGISIVVFRNNWTEEEIASEILNSNEKTQTASFLPPRCTPTTML
ncbi:hypothetical protein PF005_g2710 [Phytophthora fragariae]|uniref:Uncharacterized protein n=2 Tax=Phytophthora TaxID=4783 RepID=A0A6A3TEV2_9STRA|nr:hypothetical protein PR001_g1386 [Phytophthora rubi]KAE9135325.1 hypothetical protein PF007_g2603 [Phytophthora fragariae]KAE9232501.1 hypothetical protein PF005_g2710 [Phytophthora fragariae]KAE9252172.1 hypothetical protein PF004_g2106 [Phytophthora fragariae]KAE9320831.1 hypothetical protein PF001_g5226 [Phytophthora fragariae]